MKQPKSRLVAGLLALTFLTVGWMAAAAESAEIEPVDLNRASAQELIGLPGIGEVMAKRIIDFREQNGPFERVEDLMKVKGIGEKSFAKLRPYVRVGKSK
jgi:competence protein ComEA